MTIVFGLGMRLCVHAYKILKWPPMQQTAARVLGIAFIDKGEFETM